MASTPAPVPRTFEDLLADPHEQFDRHGELLRSVVDWTNAPSATASSVPRPNRSVTMSSPAPVPPAALLTGERRAQAPVASNGCDDCSVEPGETHRYPGCPGAQGGRCPPTRAPFRPARTSVAGRAGSPMSHLEHQRRRAMCDNCDNYDGEVTRGFRIVFPDGYTVHGAQFPSGRCVLDDTHSGLIEAAVSIAELPMARKPLARIEWADPAPVAEGGDST